MRRRAERVAAALLIAFASLLLPAGGASGARIALGVYVPHGDERPALIDSFSAKVGWRPLIVNSFKTFGQAAVYVPQLNGIRRGGAVPMISLEPQTSSGGRIKLSKIARGRYDGYLRAAARTAAAWGKPLMIRFGEEMNGTWYPWSPAHGNSARSFVAAWRHVVRLFRREGARNVRWVWTPYVDPNRNIPFARFYPGDGYVDWAGLDGYNWGGAFPWRSFRSLFASSYHRLVRITSRPLMIGEVGSGEVGGSKAAWLRSMLRRDLPRMTHIRAVVWFDARDSRGDFRVQASRAALRAFRRWTGRPLYRSTRRSLLLTPPVLSRASSRIGFGAVR